MRLHSVLLFLLVTFAFSKGEDITSNLPSDTVSICDKNVQDEATRNLFDFGLRLFKRTSYFYNHHFIISQFNVWHALAAMAEGATGPVQDKLFKILNLPQEECLRHKYYEIISTLQVPDPEVHLATRRVLALDKTLTLNRTWAADVFSKGLIKTSFLPIIADPIAAAETIKSVFKTEFLDPDFSGNSLILDSLDYSGLWAEAFPDADVEIDVPFYNDFGVPAGKVDMLRMRKKVKLAYLPHLKIKALELQVGQEGQYKMLLGTAVGRVSVQHVVNLMTNTIFQEFFENGQESTIPFEIGIPRINFTFQHDNLRYLLEYEGVTDLWKDPDSSSLISSPAALPSGYVQRSTIRFCNAGVERYKYENDTKTESFVQDIQTGVAAALGREFILNKPFAFALIDTKTSSMFFSGVFSHPHLL